MKIGIKILIIILISFVAISIQAKDKFSIHLDYNYLYGLKEKGDLWNLNSDLNGFDINISGMYDLNKRLSAGIGIGIEKLYDPAYTVLPVFVKITYSPFKLSDKPYVYTKIGYGIGTKISNAGVLFNPGFGYKIKFRKHFGINFMLGYHLQSIRYDIVTIDESLNMVGTKIGHNNRHSISFGMGFIF